MRDENAKRHAHIMALEQLVVAQYASRPSPKFNNPKQTLDQRMTELENKVEQILQRLNSIIE